MAALLLDTHILLWYFTQQPLPTETLRLIAKAQTNKELYVSAISAWEIGVAQSKTNASRRPNLRGLPVSLWFRRAVRNLGAKAIQLGWDIALEASSVPAIYGSGDPGDCFLIATARRRNLILVTRDRSMLQLSARSPDYLLTLAS